MGGHTTLSIGVRYDLEIIPLDETDNPLFPAGKKNYPVDKNNIAPRIGLTHALDAAGKSVIRGGYGMFYNRTILGAIDDTIEFPKFTSWSVVNFPNATRRSGADRRAAADRSRCSSRCNPADRCCQSRAAQLDVPARGADQERRRRDLRRAEPAAALRASGHDRLLARVDAGDGDWRRLCAHCQPGHVPPAKPQPDGAGRTPPAPGR